MAAPVTIKLRTPVQVGTKGEPITELVLKPNAKVFRDFALPMKEDGTVLYQPYALAKVGVHMAGQPNTVLDELDPADMVEVAQTVMGFMGIGQATGSAPSQS